MDNKGLLQKLSIRFNGLNSLGHKSMGVKAQPSVAAMYHLCGYHGFHLQQYLQIILVTKLLSCLKVWEFFLHSEHLYRNEIRTHIYIARLLIYGQYHRRGIIGKITMKQFRIL